MPGKLQGSQPAMTPTGRLEMTRLRRWYDAKQSITIRPGLQQFPTVMWRKGFQWLSCQTEEFSWGKKSLIIEPFSNIVIKQAGQWTEKYFTTWKEIVELCNFFLEMIVCGCPLWPAYHNFGQLSVFAAATVFSEEDLCIYNRHSVFYFPYWTLRLC